VPSDLGRVKSLVAGSTHTCAIRESDNTLRCWGADSYSQVSGQPADLGAVKAVALGAWHTCAIDASGLIRCWGMDMLRQLPAPAEFLARSDGVALSAGQCRLGECMLAWVSRQLESEGWRRAAQANN